MTRFNIAQALFICSALTCTGQNAELGAGSPDGMVSAAFNRREQGRFAVSQMTSNTSRSAWPYSGGLLGRRRRRGWFSFKSRIACLR